LRILADHEKSTKHIKAERLIEKGQSIRILRESDFMRIVSPANTHCETARR
jgi:DNA polymerase-3 subunit epsilon